MKPRKNKHFKQLLAATLAVSSSLGMITPVLADTAAGQEIKNTATATFKDGDGNSYNSTSNEVVINVAEVAGITITAETPSNSSPNGNDTLFVEFTITNIGNDRTQFFIPGTATLTSSKAGTFEQNGDIQIIEVNGNPITPINVDKTNGGFTGDLLGTDITNPNNGSIVPYPGTGASGKIKVRVPIKVNGNIAVSGDTLKVSLGNTSSQNDQNVTRVDNPNDVYTKDNPDGVGGETNATAPSNGVREAMATSAEITVGARLQAFATVLKAVSDYSSGANPNSFTDDVLTYKLAMRVENPSPAPTGFINSDLYGTAINVEGDATKSYVLVSDAIPDKMELDTTTTPEAPSGWQVVYTTDPLTTNAHKANWFKARPSGKITRVGFIYETGTVAPFTPLSKGNAGTGNTITGFSFKVTPENGFTGGQVANIAQVFGQSQPGESKPGTATQIVYDESGDQTSNNGLNGDNPDSTTGGTTTQDGGINNGKADPVADGTVPGTGKDPTDTNTTNNGNDVVGLGAGTKPKGGEDTIVTFPGTLLNGPKDKPAAVGPTDNNDDFTNKSIVVPAGKSPTALLTDADTVAVTFNNTVQNTSGSSQEISLLPEFGSLSDLPDKTKVTITFTNPATSTTTTATYTLNSDGGRFDFTSGTPVKITVPANSNANYTVTVDLPGDVEQLKPFPVIINAFIDLDNNGQSDNNEPGNKTIDRLYTNYLSLLKEARILEADGTTEVEAYTTDQAKLSAAATIGRIIEYRITYKNISSSGGTDNVILPANDLKIKEDGATAPNTWFGITVDPKYPAQPKGSADNANKTTVTVINGDIQVYEYTEAVVNPGASGTFIFQRKIK
ncbi:hypothetical protein NIES2101_14030 [Calothrix sp. HK-06]|nr:hypothetical protein NIES2101_14030 [Calothrix sp. HK-06]